MADVTITMAAEAAEKLQNALSWASAVAYCRREELRDRRDEREKIFAEHEEWLAWGVSRVREARQAGLTSA